MKYLGIILVIFNISNKSLGIVNLGSIYGDGSNPRFISRENTFSVVTGDTVVLPCEVENLEKMPILSNSVLLDVVGIIVALIIVAITYIKWKFQYWKNRNIPYLEPKIPFGNLQPPFNRKQAIGPFTKRLYDEIKEKKWKFSGVYFMLRPTFLVGDLDLLKHIMTKDFQYFTERGIYYNEKDDPLSAHLFAIGGTKWRHLRTKLTPTFTSGKMKHMFQTLVKCGILLEDLIEEKCNQHEILDIKEILGCFTTDIIGSCAFGLECNTFKDSNSPFRIYGKKVFESSLIRNLRITFTINFPSLARALHIRNLPKDVSDFFMKVVKDTIDYREKNKIDRKDFLQLLIDLKNNNQITEEQGNENIFGINEIAAQCFVFFLAGFETSSTLMTFALYELAKHQNIQDKLRNEIITVLAKYNGEVTYDCINEMTYMNQVLDEALRKYPPVPILNRKCVKDYKIPGTDHIIPENTRILIPIYGIHYDKDFYPEPEKFDPDRFTEENKQKRHQYSYLPFGEGPRNCIGLRFGLMQSKVGLVSLLKKYKFSVNSKTTQPLKFDPKTIILAVDGGVWLDLEKI